MGLIKILDAVETRESSGTESMADNRAMSPSQYPSASGSCWTISDFHEVLTGQTGFVNGKCNKVTSDFEKPMKGSVYTQRSEDQLRNNALRTATDIWQSFFIRIPSATYTQENVNQIHAQWHATVGSPLFAIFSRNGHFGIVIRWDNVSPLAESTMEFWLKPHQLDFVHKFVVRHQFRTGTNGRTTVWLDGELARCHEPNGNPWIVPSSYVPNSVGLFNKGLNNGADALPMVIGGATVLDWWGRTDDDDPVRGENNKYYKQGFYISARNSRYNNNITDPCDPAVIQSPLSNPAFNVKVAHIGSVRFWVPSGGETDEDAYRALSGDGSLSSETPSDFTFSGSSPFTVTINQATGGNAVADPTNGPAGTEITVTATLDSGWQFERFDFATGGSIATNPTIFNISSNADITPVYSEIGAPPFTVTINQVTGGNAVAVPTSGEPGTEITVTATVDSGYEFVRFDFGTGGSIDTNPAIFNISSNAVITPVYTVVSSPYSVTINQATGGNTVADPTSGVAGTLIGLEASIDNGYEFVRFDVDNGVGSIGTNPGSFTLPAAATSVTPVYSEIPTYQLLLSVNPTGYGTLAQDPAGPHQEGVTVQLTATPDSGNQFDGWYDGETLLSTNNPYNYTTLGESKTITGQFSVIPSVERHLNIGVNDTFGTIQVSPSPPYFAGTLITVTATPDPGYQFDNFSSPQIADSTENPYTFAMPDQNASITANFSEYVGYFIVKKIIS